VRHLARSLLVAAATLPVLAACACGGAAEPEAQVLGGLVAHAHTVSGSVVLTGAVPGTWHAAGDPPAICAPAAVRITIVGPRGGDVGTLSASSDGSVFLDVERYGDFHGSGAVFHPSRGFEVDADIATLRGRTAHVTGTLAC
jgi:hypothetical protein